MKQKYNDFGRCLICLQNPCQCNEPCDTIETKEEKEEVKEELSPCCNVGLEQIGYLIVCKKCGKTIREIKTPTPKEWIKNKAFEVSQLDYQEDIYNAVLDALTQQKEAIEKEWKRKNAELLESLADMYDQYCGDQSGHSFMSAGEHALIMLQEYNVITGENGMGGEGKIDYEKITKLLQ